MKSFGATLATAGLLASSALAADLAPLVISGTKFFNSQNGEQFFIKGVAYQADYTGGGAGSGTGEGNSTTGTDGVPYVDPLADGTTCARDIPVLQKLLTNTIRVYAIDPTQDHSDCMSQLQAAGIYVVADLAAPVSGQSINTDDPQWNTDLFSRYTSVVDAMMNYTNVIGFFAGNEVSDAPNNTDAMAFVKAAVRDTKAYINSTAPRPIYVGYAADDDQYIRVPLSEYMVCDDQSDAVDFWGYNIYEWCGDSSFVTSGYQARTEEFASYAKPAFFAEYGCNTPPRLFTDTPVLLGPLMDQVWSGGIIYQYFQTTNDYGLVQVIDSSSVSLLPAYTTYSSQIALASPSSTASSAYTPSNTPWACPAVSGNWSAAASPLPPTPNSQGCTCMVNSLGCVVKSSTSDTDYASYFGYICGLDGGDYCDGIAANGTTGDYGAWSMCESEDQLSFVMNRYYEGQSSNPSACSFSGNAMTQATSSATGACSSILAAAGTNGASTVSGATGSNAVGGSATSGTSKAAGVSSSKPVLISGIIPAGVMVVLAMVSGAGMILL